MKGPNFWVFLSATIDSKSQVLLLMSVAILSNVSQNLYPFVACAR